MIKLLTNTKLPNIRLGNTDNQRREFGIFIVKASFDIDEQGFCFLSKEQNPLNFTDRFFGELNITSLELPSDFVGFKPVTDVILNANAYSPTKEKLPFWDAGITIDNHIEHHFRVYGSRFWVADYKEKNTFQKIWDDKEKTIFSKWRLTEAEPCLCVPIRYENAFGGEIEYIKDNGEEEYYVHTSNPIGCGLMADALFDCNNPDKKFKAPQIEDINNPITDPYKIYEPIGTGAIAAAWDPRRPLGGTYDQNWIDNIWPHWPADYDFRYNNSANTKMQTKSWLKGDETIFLKALHPKLCQINLPQKTILVNMTFDNHIQNVLMPLDTVWIDLINMKLCLTWRITFIEDKLKQIFFSMEDVKKMAKYNIARYAYDERGSNP